MANKHLGKLDLRMKCLFLLNRTNLHQDKKHSHLMLLIFQENILINLTAINQLHHREAYLLFQSLNSLVLTIKLQYHQETKNLNKSIREIQILMLIHRIVSHLKEISIHNQFYSCHLRKIQIANNNHSITNQ